MAQWPAKRQDLACGGQWSSLSFWSLGSNEKQEGVKEMQEVWAEGAETEDPTNQYKLEKTASADDPFQTRVCGQMAPQARVHMTFRRQSEVRVQMTPKVCVQIPLGHCRLQGN